MNITYTQWHDGEPYDMGAFAQMNPAERDEAATIARQKSNPDWRDMEILGAHGGRESIERLRHLLIDGSPKSAGWALRELIHRGHTPGAVADVQLAHVLERIENVDDVMPALQIAETHAGPMTKLQLLRGMQFKPAISVNFADTLLKISGVGDAMPAFDPQLRPIILQLLRRDAGRDVALAQLCTLMKIDLTKVPLPGSRNERAWAEETWGR
jgi:hypothetical protein